MHAVGDVLGNGSGPNEIIDTGLMQIIEGEGDLERMRGLKVSVERA